MNVLVVSNMGPKKSAPVLGGFVTNQVSRLKLDFDHLTYFYMHWNGDSTFHRIFKYPVFFFHFFLSCVVSSKKYDLIHIHYYYPTIICAWLYKALRNKNVKVVVTCHGGDIYCYEKPSSVYEKLISIVDHWIFTSKKLKQSFKYKTRSYSILSAGFDEKIYFPKADLNKQFDAIFVGCLDQNKGTDRLEMLIKSCPDLKFIVIGMGPNLIRLKELTRTESNLTVTGALPATEVANYINRSRVLISLSRNESFGLVMTEAMACGVPVIATKNHGSQEQLDGSEFLLSQDDEAQLQQQLMDKVLSLLALQPEKYQELSAKARFTASRYTLEYVSNEITKIYRGLVE